MNKKEIRKYITNLKQNMQQEEVERLSEKLAECFFSLPQYKNASCVFAYASYNQEVKTGEIIKRAVRDGKRVAVPRVVEDHLEFRYITSAGELKPGTRGIPEPGTKQEKADEKEEDVLMLIPGLAFDCEGQRIGYGLGYYDRYLAAHKSTRFTIVALCFDFQVLDPWEAEEHDRPVDILITPSGQIK